MILSFSSSRRNSPCQSFAVAGKTSDKNLEQRVNMKFCVKIGESSSQTLAYGEYAMKKLSVEWHRWVKEWRRIM
jgi:hypothetical protein